MSGDDDRTIVDLNIHEAMAKDQLSEANAHDSEFEDEDQDEQASESQKGQSGISDEDLLADLNFALDEDEVPAEASPEEAEEAPRAKRERATSSSKRSNPEADEPNPKVMQALSTVPLEVVAILGKKRLSVKEIAKLRAGSVLAFDGDEDRVVDLVCQGKTLGKGELVLVDGKLGVKIVKYF